MRVGLWIYDRMGGGSSRWIGAAAAAAMEPQIRREGLLGAMLYDDARTDDARLTLRLIFDTVALGGTARNYTRVVELLKRDGVVRGIGVQDLVDGTARERARPGCARYVGVTLSSRPRNCR
jgi:glycerol-3-phosphate dehydrogenase